MTEVSTRVAAETTPAASGTAYDGLHPDTLGLSVVLEPGSAWVDLACVREDLRDLHHDRAELFDAFCQTAVPLDLQAEKQGEAPDDLWNVWLFRGTGDQQLMDFLQWNVDSIARQQADARFQAVLGAERLHFKQGVKAGLSGGWLHPDFETAIDGVDDLQVYVGDGFNTHANSYSGYHIRGTQEIVIAGAKTLFGHGFDDLYARTRRIAGHEFNHPFGRLRPRWINEALTEHSALTYEYGQPHLIRPEDRARAGRTYTAERALMGDFLGPVAVESATLAYSQNAGDEHENSLVEAINGVWAPFMRGGRTAFGQLNGLVLALEDLYVQEKDMLPIAAGSRAATEVRQLLAKDPASVFSTIYESPDQVRGLVS